MNTRTKDRMLNNTRDEVSRLRKKLEETELLLGSQFKEDQKQLDELRAWKVQWSGSLELSHNKVAADAIRKMKEELMLDEWTETVGIFEWMDEYANNLEDE